MTHRKRNNVKEHTQRLPSGYHEYRPHPTLTRHIACYWSYLIQPSIIDSTQKPIIPDGCVDIILDLSEQRTNTQIVGTMTKPLKSEHTTLIGVRFLPGQPYSFLQTPLQSYTDQLVDLSDIHQNTENIEEKLSEEQDIETIIYHLNTFFSSAIKPMNVRDQKIIEAITIFCNQRDVTLSAFSDEVGMSRQHLTRKCHRYVGVSPKMLSRIIRLNRAISYKKESPFYGWADLAIQTGYYDQAHMINDFQKLTGSTPSNYFTT